MAECHSGSRPIVCPLNSGYCPTPRECIEWLACRLLQPDRREPTTAKRKEKPNG